MKTRLPGSGFLIAVALLASGACTEVIIADPTYVAVTEIEVANESDSGTLLEIEVHLFDARSGAFLGCSGERDGLGDVDRSGVAYLVTAFFGRAPGGADLLTVDELVGRDLYAVVIEDDDEPCPVPSNDGTLDAITGRPHRGEPRIPR